MDPLNADPGEQVRAVGDDEQVKLDDAGAGRGGHERMKTGVGSSETEARRRGWPRRVARGKVSSRAMDFVVTQGVQFSVFIDNRPGALARVASILAERNIRILAISLTEGLDHGYARLVVDRPDEAAVALRAADLLFFSSRILLAEIGSEPADVARLLEHWGADGVNVEYAYTGESADGRRLLAARVDRPIPSAAPER